MPQLRTWCAAALLLGWAAGCAGSGRPPHGRAPGAASPPWPPLRGPLAAADPSAARPDSASLASLAGRVLVLDPGHGGRWPGVVGAGGLRECDLNLRVARALQSRLLDARARAILTRASDRETVPGTDATLREDLARRAAIANACEPDLFLSIHHNSSLPLDRTRSATEAYYRLDDDGPSRDAARRIHAAMRRGLGLPAGPLTPANYHVLREARVPAVLCEAAYLSHPEIESALAAPEAAEREAQVYLAALAAYFGAGVPRIAERDAAPSPLREPRPVFLFELHAGSDAPEHRILPASIEAELDGVPLAPDYDAALGLLWCRPPRPLAGGKHRILVRARNASGNAAAPFSREFTVELPAASLRLEAFPPQLPARGAAAARITLELRDAWGHAVPASPEALRLEIEGATLRDPLAFPPGAAAQAILAADGGGLPIRVRAFAAAPGAGETADTLRAELALARSEAAPSLLHGRVLPAGPAGPDSAARALPAARVWLEGLPLPPATADDRGFWFLPLPAGPDGGPPSDSLTVRIARAGYAARRLRVATPASAAADLGEWQLAPFAGGSLHGLRVALDPEGGGAPETAAFAGDLPAGDWTLMIARELAAYLAAAGALPFLTRASDAAVGALERVRTAEARQAELLVRIVAAAGGGPAERAPVLRVGHYPGSAVGAALAESLSATVAELTGIRPRVGETAGFVVQQVRAPAVEVACGGWPERDRDLSAAARGLAFALLQGILAQRVPDISGSGEAEVRGGGPDALSLDGVLPLPAASGDGRILLRRLAPGTHAVESVPDARTPGAPPRQAQFQVHAGVRAALTWPRD